MEIKAQEISKNYGSLTILDEISFVIERGQKVGLVGFNGTGKSTLLKIIAGLIEPDSGTISFRKGLVIGYMPQDTSLATDETIEDYLRKVSGIAEIEEEMETSAEAMAEYERRDGYSFYARMETILAGFGLGRIDTGKSVNTLSSGQKSKVFMAGILLKDADILLLDEPTNNLDIPALIWLENFLVRNEMACMVVSHDRLFLDRVVRKIFEIDWRTRKLSITNGSYSEYLERKRKERERQKTDYEAQQEEVGRLKESARSKRISAEQGSRYQGTDNDKFLRGFKRDQAAGSAKSAKAIEKRIEQIPLIEKPVERDAFRIHIKPHAKEGSKDVVLKDVICGYPNNGFRIGPISLEIPYGNRTTILGLNGSGKTTLLKTVDGELSPISGEVRIGNGIVAGNLMQEHDNLPRGSSIKDFLAKKGGLRDQEIFSLAKKFGFSAGEINKEISGLSPGERSRLLFALFSSLSVNFLILDEPTNHLDLEALEALEEMVANYQGTVILVSHDRYFLKRFRSTDTYLMIDNQLKWQKDIETYIAQAEREAKRLVDKL